MTKVLNHNDDGANRQSQAVLAIFQYLLGDGIEDSWDGEEYEAKIDVARWENCREQGYILTMRSKNRAKQFNAIFFEHRNSDGICAVKWTQRPTLNTPTINTADFGDIYKDKWDTSKCVPYGQVLEMAEWLINEFTKFWNNHK